MRILSIDPGFERMGVAILEKDPATGKELLIYSSCIRTPKEMEFGERLFTLGNAVEEIVNTYHPSVLVLEELFFANNQKTVMKVAEARGMLLYVGKKMKLQIAEYTPLQIKTAMTGHGGASKDQVALMVKRLVHIEDGKRLDDELDAIACGLTHFAYSRVSQLSTH